MNESSEGAFFVFKFMFRKPSDFVYNGFFNEIPPKCMEICSRNETTFSLTVLCVYGEINTVDGNLVPNKEKEWSYGIRLCQGIHKFG